MAFRSLALSSILIAHSYALPVVAKHDNVTIRRALLQLESKAPSWVSAALNAQTHECVYDTCPQILVEGAGQDNTNGIYTRDPRKSCDDALYGTGANWEGYRNANNAIFSFGPPGRVWEGWRIVTSGHVRYYHAGDANGPIPEGQWRQREGGGHGGALPLPTVTCLSGVDVVWTVVSASPTAQFKTTTAQSYSEEQARMAESSLSLGASYSGVDVSTSYTNSVSRVVRSGMTNTREETCDNPCGSDRKLFVQQFSTGSIMATPECGLVTCVPYDAPDPQCPIEYCGGDLLSGCQCCTSLEFLDPSFTGPRPPLCATDHAPDWAPVDGAMSDCVYDTCPQILVEGAGQDNTNGIYTRESGRSCDDAGYRNANNAVIVFGGGTGPGWLEGWHIVTSGHIRYYHPAEPGSTIPEGQWLQRTGGGHGGSTPLPTVTCLTAVNVAWRIVSSNPTATFQTTIAREFDEMDERTTEVAVSIGASYSGVSASSSYTNRVSQKVTAGLSNTREETCPNPCGESRNLWVQDYATSSSVITPGAVS